MSAARRFLAGSMDAPSVFDALRAAGIMACTRPWFGGLGTLFVLHRVCRDDERPLAPMFVTTSALSEMIGAVTAAGWEVVSLDTVAERAALGTSASKRPWAAFTFDDGYLDNLTLALPVFQRHGAPFAVYLCTGFLDRTVDPWWAAIDRVIQERDEVIVEPEPGVDLRFPCRTRAEKESAYRNVWDRLFEQDATARGIQRRFYLRHGVDPHAEMQRIAMDWHQARTLAADPRVTIGAHTINHPALPRLEAAEAEREILGGRDRIASELGISVNHFAYPFGYLGPREIAITRAAGFRTATTTRSGNLFARQTELLHCLPRRNYYEDPAAPSPGRARRFVHNSVRGCDLLVNALRGRPRRITPDLWS